MTRLRRSIAAIALLAGLLPAAFAQAQEIPVEQVVRTALFAQNPGARRAALEFLVQRGKPDVAAALIQALRFVPDPGGHIVDSLRALTGADIGHDWAAWVLWQEEHDEIAAFPGFDALKADVMAWIDPNFRAFVPSRNSAG